MQQRQGFPTVEQQRGSSDGAGLEERRQTVAAGGDLQQRQSPMVGLPSG